MIFIGLGANIDSRIGTPLETLSYAIEALDKNGICVLKKSSFWKSAPVPISDQPWYYNAVILVETDFEPHKLLERLHDLEGFIGRKRALRNEARGIDLDLIAYKDLVGTDPDCMYPHPRMHERAFVLQPMQEICQSWVHPVLKQPLSDLISLLSSDQMVERLKKDAA